MLVAITACALPTGCAGAQPAGIQIGLMQSIRKMATTGTKDAAVDHSY